MKKNGRGEGHGGDIIDFPQKPLVEQRERVTQALERLNSLVREIPDDVPANDLARLELTLAQANIEVEDITLNYGEKRKIVAQRAKDQRESEEFILLSKLSDLPRRFSTKTELVLAIQRINKDLGFHGIGEEAFHDSESVASVVFDETKFNFNSVFKIGEEHFVVGYNRKGYLQICETTEVKGEKHVFENSGVIFFFN